MEFVCACAGSRCSKTRRCGLIFATSFILGALKSSPGCTKWKVIVPSSISARTHRTNCNRDFPLSPYLYNFSCLLAFEPRCAALLVWCFISAFCHHSRAFVDIGITQKEPEKSTTEHFFTKSSLDEILNLNFWRESPWAWTFGGKNDEIWIFGPENG